MELESSLAWSQDASYGRPEVYESGPHLRIHIRPLSELSGS